MSNLIITIIAIALGAAVVLASIYSGGSALTQGAAKSAATAVLNQGQQISGAATMYSNDFAGAALPALADLVVNTANNQYLKSVPLTPASVNSAGNHSWTLGTGQITTPTTSLDVCLNVEKQRDSTIASIPTAEVVATGTTFGCFGSASPYTIFYNL